MSDAYACAQRLLARREHGAEELRSKLLQKGFTGTEINQVLAKCQRLDLQNDLRFAESLCRSRIQQGYGPLRIRQELQAKGIATELIEQVIHKEEDNWLTYARAVWEKKFKSRDAQDFAVLQKQKQFMYYRGFSLDTITRILRDL